MRVNIRYKNMIMAVTKKLICSIDHNIYRGYFSNNISFEYWNKRFLYTLSKVKV